MQISKINLCSQSFQARIKLKKPDDATLKRLFLAGTVSAAGVASTAEGILTSNVAGYNYKSLESVPQNIVQSHEEILFSNGNPNNLPDKSEFLPVQSVIIPSGLLVAGLSSMTKACETFSAISEEKHSGTQQ